MGSAKWIRPLGLLILIAIGWIFLAAGSAVLLGKQFEITNPLYQGALVCLAALVVLPVGRWVASPVEKEIKLALNPPSNDPLASNLDGSPASDLREITDGLRRRILREFPVGCLHIFLGDPSNGVYQAVEGGDGKPTSDLQFSKHGPLVKVLSQQNHFFMNNDNRGDIILQPDQARIKLLAAQLFIPLKGKDQLLGWIALGNRSDREPYHPDDLDLLEQIAAKSASVIERVRLFETMEKRLQEMTVLTRVAQGVNATLRLNDIFELIFTQTTQILPADEFHILLFEDPEENPVQVFSIDHGERIQAEENIRLDAGMLPEYEAIRSGRGYLSEDFSRELVLHGTAAGDEAPTSWISAPLRAGAEVIGAISLGRREPATMFSGAQLQTLQAIADLAAGAIIKTRLLAESEKRNTMTDQALAARVEELSVMQLIDRELNTSLDINRAMKITLEWAMRQSGASAGLVGMVEAGGIQLMASQGYLHELDAYKTELLPANMVCLDRLMADGKPVVISQDQSAAALLIDGKSQVVIPIQREGSVTGVILLESCKTVVCSEEALGFLMRLGDHASIAIANARLYDAVQAANVAKSEFVSFVAHELKNPMTSIKGYTELLAARAVGPVNDTQANFLQVIRSNIDRMNTLVSDLNDLSKIEAGQLRLEFSRIDLKDVVADVERSTRRQIDEKGQQFETQLPQDLPAILADSSRLIQILTNLISNAHKYTEQGGKITLGAKAQAHEPGTPGEVQLVHVWVQDNGIGITAEDQSRIFQKFFRSDDPKTREIPGAGLGLNITRSLVEMQGGKIWFESKFREGTTFHFTVPVSG